MSFCYKKFKSKKIFFFWGGGGGGGGGVAGEGARVSEYILLRIQI